MLYHSIQMKHKFYKNVYSEMEEFTILNSHKSQNIASVFRGDIKQKMPLKWRHFSIKNLGKTIFFCQKCAAASGTG
jgi:hypothetical protein